MEVRGAGPVLEAVGGWSGGEVDGDSGGDGMAAKVLGDVGGLRLDDDGDDGVDEVVVRVSTEKMVVVVECRRGGN
ncbi:hypothetical protein L1987_18512 [Smallanthus sonchifolius]|uniref:Uncharacterized protein n=1 Tax=Smallanthus sonchifolius TaxID=185202 RepID=A0ACB9J1F7_9ASTR|nr:hypothetical protein L1987_18512 [Smallanthus sonchifolius]